VATTLMLVSGCAVFQGGDNCDCPRFSQAEPEEQENAVILPSIIP
jgi:hypothetical protein